MPTATRAKPPSAVHTNLVAKRDETYAAVQKVKRRRDGYEQETEAMRGRLTERQRTHDEEFTGASRMVKPGTEAAQLRDAIRNRQGEPNPHQEEYDEKVAEFHAADNALEEWKERNVQARIDERGPKIRAAETKLREAFELLLTACRGEYGAEVERVRDIAVSTRGLNGQDDDAGRGARVRTGAPASAGHGAGQRG